LHFATGFQSSRPDPVIHLDRSLLCRDNIMSFLGLSPPFFSPCNDANGQNRVETRKPYHNTATTGQMTAAFRQPNGQKPVPGARISSSHQKIKKTWVEARVRISDGRAGSLASLSYSFLSALLHSTESVQSCPRRSPVAVMADCCAISAVVRSIIS